MVDLLPGAAAAGELCQLATPYAAELHPKRAIVQEKYDGIRCLWLNGEPYTREGVPMVCASHAQGQILQLQKEFGHPLFVDSEFTAGTFEQTLAAFRSGQCGGVLHVFDALPFDQWARAGQTAPLRVRLAMLESIPQGPFPHLRFEHDMTNGVDTGLAVAKDLRDWIVERGGEGVMVKDADAGYFRGRSRQWLKFKRQDTVDGVIRSVHTHGGKLRSIDVAIGDKLVVIGSGWTPGTRPVGIEPGAQVEMKHNGRTASGAYRHATFVRVRT